MPFLTPKEAGLEIPDDDNEGDIYCASEINKHYEPEPKATKPTRINKSTNALNMILENLRADQSNSDEEDDEAPKDVHYGIGGNSAVIAKIKEREILEESTLNRMILTKKQKQMERKVMRGDMIDDGDEAEMMKIINGEGDPNIFKPKKNKKSKRTKKSHPSKGGKRQKRH